jgi:hypothetical protein
MVDDELGEGGVAGGAAAGVGGDAQPDTRRTAATIDFMAAYDSAMTREGDRSNDRNEH